MKQVFTGNKKIHTMINLFQNRKIAKFTNDLHANFTDWIMDHKKIVTAITSGNYCLSLYISISLIMFIIISVRSYN